MDNENPLNAPPTVTKGAWVDSLLPASLPPEIDRLASLSFRDGGTTFHLGPGDQLLAALIRLVLGRGSNNQHLVIGLPVGSQDVAALCGFVAQLIRVQAWYESGRSSPAAFSGPTIVVARDTAVQRRLSNVSLRGARFDDGMAEAISACRIRADGRIVEPDGFVNRYEVGRRRLLYLNSRVGWPDLNVEDAFGVIDRTTLRDRKSYAAALAWAKKRCSRLITVANLDDGMASQVCEELGLEPIVWPLTHNQMADLSYVLGLAEDATALSTNRLLKWDPKVLPVPVGTSDLDSMLLEGYGALSSARQVEGDYPPAIRKAAQLLSTVSGCVVPIDQYGEHAALDPRIESPRSLHRALESYEPRFSGPWQSFGSTSWAKLRGCAIGAYELIRAHNPKQEALFDVLDLIRRRDNTARVTVRVSNRIAAPLCESKLSDADLMDERTSVLPWSTRQPWLSSDIEIWASLPPLSRRSLMHSAEASEVRILSYVGEMRALEMAMSGAAIRFDDLAAAAAGSLGVQVPSPAWTNPLVTVERHEVQTVSSVQLDVDFDRIVSRATEALSELEAPEESTSRETTESSSPAELIPVVLDDESTWWLTEDDTVGVVIAEKYSHRLVPDLRTGDLVVVPRGEGREELYSRLVEAVHLTGDVRDLDFMLARFRKACRSLYHQSGSNWAEAKRRMQAAKASAWHQIQFWAEGETIAPADPGDVKIVASLVGDEELLNGWRRVSAVAVEMRNIHRQIGHLVSKALREMVEGEGPNLEAVRSKLPEDVSEILDEFVIRRIVDVRSSETRPSHYHGRLTTDL